MLKSNVGNKFEGTKNKLDKIYLSWPKRDITIWQIHVAVERYKSGCG